MHSFEVVHGFNLTFERFESRLLLSILDSFNKILLDRDFYEVIPGRSPNQPSITLKSIAGDLIV